MIFIAEIGMNHNGNFGLLQELIRQAKKAGADIAKFQLGWRCGEGEINQITPDTISDIIRFADYHGIEPMFSLITRDAFETARQFDFNRYKVASRTVRDDMGLVRDILAEGKETIVSLGMWDGEGLPIPQQDNLKYLWCKSEYPAAPWDLVDLPKNFTDSPYTGYSDHSIGIDIPLLAISRGAEIVEKHFTLDKSDTTIRDHALSATPDEFATMVEHGRAIRRALDLGV